MRKLSSLLVAAYGGVALATILSMGTLLRVLEEMKTTGGGIASFASGVWQAVRMPLAASWIAGAVTVVALVIALLSSRDSQSEGPAKHVWGIGALTLFAGIVPVFAFERAVAYIVDIIRPGHQPAWITSPEGIARAAYSSIIGAGTAAAICFVIALVLIARIRRRGTAPRRVVLAMLVVSLIASAMLISELRAYSHRWEGIAIGGQSIEEAQS